MLRKFTSENIRTIIESTTIHPPLKFYCIASFIRQTHSMLAHQVQLDFIFCLKKSTNSHRPFPHSEALLFFDNKNFVEIFNVFSWSSSLTYQNCCKRTAQLAVSESSAKRVEEKYLKLRIVILQNGNHVKNRTKTLCFFVKLCDTDKSVIFIKYRNTNANRFLRTSSNWEIMLRLPENSSKSYNIQLTFSVQLLSVSTLQRSFELLPLLSYLQQ